MRSLPLFAALLLLAFALAAPAAAQPAPDPQNLDHDFGMPTPPPQWPIPPVGAAWHEMYPTWCVQHVQGDYQDNGDGVVSICDNIQLGGNWYHVDDVYPTYFFSGVAGPAGSGVADPSIPNPPEGPVGDVWHILHGDDIPFGYCDEVVIDGWEDSNGNGTLDVCDNISFGGAWYHIDAVHCDITVTPNPTDVRKDSWGWLKNLFK